MFTIPNSFFQFLVSATRGFCTESIQHWILTLRRFCQHFFALMSKKWQEHMFTISNSFFQVSNSGQKWFLCRRHRELKPHFEKVLTALLHIVVQNFGNNRCSPFQIRSSELLIPATRGFCADGKEHWNLPLESFCQHFFTSLSKILESINVDPSKCILPSFWIHPRVVSVLKAYSAEGLQCWSHAFRRFRQSFFTSLSTILVIIDVHPSKFIILNF